MNPNYADRSRDVAGYANAAAVPMAQVPSALSGLDSANERLHERISTLEQRLGAILSPPPPSSVSETGKMARHSIALQIEAGAQYVSAAADRLDSIIGRLEV